MATTEPSRPSKAPTIKSLAYSTGKGGNISDPP
eukprot:CAMPEP_0201559592 /NCGR_PEP_ID=MMETSP0173_2-20130828/75007_1 /ASSEMBLY_ACC=CAM_ASM_000268 /TAXON_ID=218659 /ORGANISM="Vexillifera sp., Strain DIVA3 564/2" /LENGTH=32 /DNA_ID= /DNA_START= /DNA_END= /DNA_ORIENTATION=